MGEDTRHGHQCPERTATSRGMTGGAVHRGLFPECYLGILRGRYYSGDRVVNRALRIKQYDGNGSEGMARIVQEYKFKPSADGEQMRREMSKYNTCVLILTIVLNN